MPEMCQRTLSYEEKLSLDKKIDEGLPKSIAFSDGSHPILTILRAAEHRSLSHDLAIHDRFGSNAGTVASDITREALHWAVKISSSSPITGGNLSITENSLSEGMDLLQLLADYSEVCDLMTAAFLEGVELERLGDNEFLFKLTDDLIDYEAANWLWLSNDEEVPAPTLSLRGFEAWFSDNANLPDRPEQVIFYVPLEILLGIMQSMTAHADRQWQLPKSVSFGSFELHHFRLFWPALLTCAVVPKIIFNNTKIINTAVPVGTYSQWCALLANLSGLDPKIVQTIVEFLTYTVDTTVKSKNKKVADVISQPLFCIGNELALSSFLSIGSSAERNLFNLVANKLGKLYDQLKKDKEYQWAEELATKFEKLGLHAAFQKEYREDGRTAGDIDLFVCDKENQLSLIVQLKWFLVDRVKSGHLKQANEGVRQARDCVDWIQRNPSAAATLLGLTDDEIGRMKFLPLVAIKEGILNGFALSDYAPIVGSKILNHFIDLCGADLEKLWRSIADKKFLPTRNEFYTVRYIAPVPSSGRQFNGIRFRKHLVLAAKPWTPESIKV